MFLTIIYHQWVFRTFSLGLRYFTPALRKSKPRLKVEEDTTLNFQGPGSHPISVRRQIQARIVTLHVRIIYDGDKWQAYAPQEDRIAPSNHHNVPRGQRNTMIMFARHCWRFDAWKLRKHQICCVPVSETLNPADSRAAKQVRYPLAGMKDRLGARDTNSFRGANLQLRSLLTTERRLLRLEQMICWFSILKKEQL